MTFSHVQYDESDEGGMIFALIALCVVVVLFLLIGSKGTLHKGYKTQDEACKAFYGQEYVYQHTPYNPRLCVTVNGDVRYYELIEEAK